MKIVKNFNPVIPAQAGIHRFYSKFLWEVVCMLRGNYFIDWIPARAGMTK